MSKLGNPFLFCTKKRDSAQKVCGKPDFLCKAVRIKNATAKKIQMANNSNLLRAALAFLFFTLVGFVFLVGLMDWGE